MSRVASLLAIAVFGLVLSSAFNRELDRHLATLDPEVRRTVDAQRSRLAGAEAPSPQARRAIQESFVVGYRRVLLGSAILAIFSAISAAALVHEGPDQ